MKNLIFLSCLILSLSTFGFNSLLTDDDFATAEYAYLGGPTLSSAEGEDTQWESYNQWQCFPSHGISFDCIEYEGGQFVPSLSTVTENGVIAFDIHLEDGISCDDTIPKWRELIGNGEEVCVFAAHIPTVEMATTDTSGKALSLWYIDQIKGQNGYWKIGDYSKNIYK